MNNKLLILAAISLGICQSAEVKESSEAEMDLSGLNSFFDVITRFPNLPNCLPPPLCLPPVPETCPEIPDTTLPETGILVGFGTQEATEAFVEDIVLEDTACMEETDAEIDSNGTFDVAATSCSCGLKKYILCGTIDYTRETQQHELGEIRSVSVAESCVQITANAGFLGGDLE
jgi:hypothetical protein